MGDGVTECVRVGKCVRRVVGSMVRKYWNGSVRVHGKGGGR